MLVHLYAGLSLSLASLVSLVSLVSLADAQVAVPAERVLGPTYTVDPLIQDQGKRKGKRFSFKMPLRGSHSIFNGSDPALDPNSPPNTEREIFVNIPAAYKDGSAAPVLVVQDGGYGDHTDWIDNVQSNLAYTDSPLPPFVTISVANGGGSERSLEYNAMSDRYARFVVHEVLPAVLKRPDVLAAFPQLRFTSDPGGRAAMGCSAGGAASITMAFFRPDLFTRVAAYSPAAVDLQVPKQPEKLAFPLGGREYWDGQRLIATQPKKPLRVFVNDNEFDLGWGGNCPAWVDKEVGNTTAEYELGCWATWDCSPPGYCADGYHGFALGGNRTAAALKAAGYAYQHVFGLNQWHCGNKYDPAKKPAEFDPSVWTETLADTLVWVWEGYGQ
jgi:S-formylglutathione hydrolase FrmB